jgi:hypothetical protein
VSLLLNPRVLIALALAGLLAFSHFAVYRTGKANVQSKWTASIAAANEDARKLERSRQSAADGAARLAAVRQSAISADASRARSELGGMRDDLDAIQRASAQSLAAATKSVAALSNVFQQCSRSYQELAEIADRHANDALNLRQAWPK